MDLQLGLAETEPGQSHTELLRELADQAAPWIDPKVLESFRHNWHLNNDPQGTTKESSPATQSKTLSVPSLAVQLLAALHPQLHPNAPGSPVERETRCQQLIDKHQQHYRVELRRSVSIRKTT